MASEPMLTCTQIALALGVSRQWVSLLIHSGALPAQPIGRGRWAPRYRIAATAFRAFLRQRTFCPDDLSAQGAAQHLGLSVQRVHRLITRQVVPAHRHGGRWAIHRADLPGEAPPRGVPGRAPGRGAEERTL